MQGVAWTGFAAFLPLFGRDCVGQATESLPDRVDPGIAQLHARCRVS
jgi:hypothetical protein